MRILAADIGGTRARFGLFAADARGGLGLVKARAYRSAAFDGPLSALRAFRREAPEAVDLAAVAVAGPVTDGAATLTNLPWTLSEAELAQVTGATSVLLLNDFEALGHLVGRLEPGDTVDLQRGDEDARGAVALLGAGTGLGAAYVTRDASGATAVHPCEGGHADFAARSDTEWELRAFLARRHGQASWERVLSGPGLADLYDFVVASGREPASPETRAAMSRGDPARALSRRALAGADRACVRALEIFVSAYGACAGDLALTVGATGGLYVAGGIAPRILPALRQGGFVDAFRAKDRMAHWLGRVPVRVLVRKRAGVLGAASAALDRAGLGPRRRVPEARAAR